MLHPPLHQKTKAQSSVLDCDYEMRIFLFSASHSETGQSTFTNCFYTRKGIRVKNICSVFRVLEILRGSQISLSCSSKRCRLPLISALLKASRREKWLYPSCAIRNRRKRLRERKCHLFNSLTKDFQKSENLHWWCSWRNGLVQLFQSWEEQREMEE